MPTQSTTYNTRLTDEGLEKRFRDTFKSQSGAELVDDLYASGVIVPVVDFTQAAEGAVLPSNLQTAWDFTTGHATVNNTSSSGQVIISNSGFWKVDLTVTGYINTTIAQAADVSIRTGLGKKIVWGITGTTNPSAFASAIGTDNSFIVYLRAGDDLNVQASSEINVDIWYRQIADASGNLTNPNGFTSS